MDGLPTADRLHSALTLGYERLRPHRDHRAAAIDALVGGHYDGRGSRSSIPLRRPLNLIYQQLSATLPAILLGHARVEVRPKAPGLELEARVYETLINSQMQALDVEREVLERMAAEAMLSPLAACYTGLRSGAQLATSDGRQYDPGEPYTQAIDFGDYLIDPDARRRSDRRWEAFRLRTPRALLLASEAHAAQRDRVATLPAASNADDSMRSDDTADNLFDDVELYHVVMYLGDRVYEAQTSVHAGEYLLEPQEWVGAGGSPIDHLCYLDVPGMAMPLSPIAAARDMAEDADTLMAKLVEQAKRSRKILGYSKDGQDLAADIKETDDGSQLRMDDPRSAQVFDLDLVSDTLGRLMPAIMGAWNNVAGNPALVGGQGRIADTAMESGILAGQAGVRVGHMQRRVARLLESIATRWLYYYATDPQLKTSVDLGPANAQTILSVPFTAAERIGTHDQFSVRVSATPLAGQDPNLRARRVIEALDVVGRMVPLAQAGVIDLRGLARELSRELGADGLERVLADPQLMQESAIVAQAVAAREESARQGVTRPAGGLGPETARGLRAQVAAGA